MHEVSGEYSLKGMIAAYCTILGIAGLQVELAYRASSAGAHLTEMLGLGVAQAVIAALFFMHLLKMKTQLMLLLIVAAMFLLLLMNGLWPDSFRILQLRPWAN